ncbi:MAG: hypothetical protein NTU49_09010 [Gammaproteobacteria bacterium]|nr:hypothetical protein [Gammaproteobacteria bacterium]
MRPQNVHPLLARILPFLIMAVMLVVFVIGLFIFTYVFIFALVLGTILFIVGFIRTKFFKPKSPITATPEVKIGRIIEHDEENKQ